MDFVLVFPLILALLFTGQSYTEVTEQTSKCYAKCPAGYYKVGDCNDQAAKHRCEQCKNTTYTEIENTIRKCLRCGSCSSYEVEKKPCYFNSNVVCECKEGYYNAGSNTGRRCMLCNHKDPENTSDYKTKCCQRIETSSANPPATTNTSSSTSTTIFMTKCTTSTATSAGATASNNSSNPLVYPVPPNLNPMPWLFSLGVIVTFLVLFWLLLCASCSCRSTNKDLEDPKFNEQSSHQEDISPTTLTFNISEETSMMNLNQSPATPEHATYISPLLPNTEHKAARHFKQSENWPAIILYAIIKEVPLRRWKEFLRLLSVADQQLDRVEMEAGLGLSSIEKQYQMLRLWSQRSSASLTDVFSALHYMDLSGCAQLLQESLEKLQWRPEQNHGFTA